METCEASKNSSKSRGTFSLTWKVFPSVWSCEIENSDLLSERTPVQPPLWREHLTIPRQWQLHGGQVRTLELTFPHTDLEMLVNGTVFLLQQVLKQVLSVLSVYIFASFPRLISCPQNLPVQVNTTVGFTVKACSLSWIYANTPKAIPTQKLVWIRQEIYVKKVRTCFIQGLLACFQTNLAHSCQALWEPGFGFLILIPQDLNF